MRTATPKAETAEQTNTQANKQAILLRGTLVSESPQGPLTFIQESQNTSIVFQGFLGRDLLDASLQEALKFLEAFLVDVLESAHELEQTSREWSGSRHSIDPGARDTLVEPLANTMPGNFHFTARLVFLVRPRGVAGRERSFQSTGAGRECFIRSQPLQSVLV